MKKSTRNNLTLIARGACLGYAICFCLGVVVFYFGGFSLFMFKARTDLIEALCISSFIAFWGMGLGIATELSLENRSFRGKLVPYFVGILFSPPLISVILFNLLYLLTQDFRAIIFTSLLTFVSIGYSFASFYYTKAKAKEFIAYLAGYFSLCFVLLLSIILIQVFEHYINSRLLGFTTIYLSVAILSLIFSTTSVSLTKLFFSRIKKV